jgi:hypothetical protein
LTVFSGDYAAVGAPVTLVTPQNDIDNAVAQNNQNQPVDPAIGNVEDNPNERNRFWTGIITKGFSTTSGGGVGTRYARTTFGSIADGSSNTILYMEKSAAASNYSGQAANGFANLVGETFGSLGAGNYSCWRAISVPVADGDNTNAFGGARVNSDGVPTERGVGSAHPGTVNMVLGDGSTHAGSNTASLASLWALQDKSDGVVFGVDEL